MEIKNLQILITLSKEKHFNRAAQKLNISQPALSMKLKSLENELGIALVHRGKNFVSLTPEGEILKGKFNDLLLRFDEIKQISSELKNSLTGKLNFGVIPSALIASKDIIHKFSINNKNINTKVSSMPSKEIERQLQNYEIDFGITYLENEPIDGVIKHHLYNEDYYLVTSDPNFKKSNSVSWKNCMGLDFCLLSQDNQFRRILNTVFKNLFLNPKISIESNSFSHIYSQVNESSYSTIMPFSIIDSYKFKKSVFVIKLIEPKIYNSIGLIYMKDKSPMPIKASFLKSINTIDK